MPTVRRFRITVNGKVYEVQAEELTTEEAASAPATKSSPAPAKPVPAKASVPAKPAASDGTAIDAPLPGLVLDVKVVEGQAVEAGQVLVILEAMKMENEIVAPEAGNIAAVRVAKGDSVSAGDVLVVLH